MAQNLEDLLKQKKIKKRDEKIKDLEKGKGKRKKLKKRDVKIRKPADDDKKNVLLK